jgi:aryl-alcohol dehydrogenase-like predicted oxidoreductase
VKDHPALGAAISERSWKIAGELVKVAKEIGRSPAQVALNWITNRPAVSSTIIGASKVQQLDDNLASLNFAIPPELSKRLDEISAPELTYPYYFFYKKEFRDMVTGSTSVRPTQTGIAA